MSDYYPHESIALPGDTAPKDGSLIWGWDCHCDHYEHNHSTYKPDLCYWKHGHWQRAIRPFGQCTVNKWCRS